MLRSTGRSMSGSAGTIPMSGSLRSTRWIPDEVQVNDAVGRAWEWQRNCQRILQICSSMRELWSRWRMKRHRNLCRRFWITITSWLWETTTRNGKRIPGPWHISLICTMRLCRKMERYLQVRLESTMWMPRTSIRSAGIMGKSRNAFLRPCTRCVRRNTCRFSFTR